MSVALKDLLSLPLEEQLEPLTRVANGLADAIARGEQPGEADQAAVVAALVALVESGVGEGRVRLELGEALGRLGDPRLRLPGDADYWVDVPLEGYSLRVGRFLVTNWEWQRWVDEGGYARDEHWTAAGLSWRDGGSDRWSDLMKSGSLSRFLVPNQPVVGVNWYEAMAYARSFGARLPERAERGQIIRGVEKRPYPWGEPFGAGNANTREEVLGRSCAVGLFRADVTPEGVWDLAGNAAEWSLDEVGDKRVIHPGSWKQPSMASWAKALALLAPEGRAPDLGFRLVAEAP